MSLLDRKREISRKESEYLCKACGYTTKQLAGIEVMHRCPATKSLQTMKEQT